MLKNVIGAVLGSKLAPKSPTTGSATGAMLASAVPFVLSRFSIPTMLAVGAGGYLIKRHLDKKAANEQPPEQKDALKSKATGKRTKTAKKAVDAGIVNPPPGGATNGSGKTPGASAGAAA
ncbi:hypothetical protein [Erythrobacter sp. THAF29]|uniref:hypothetical protein n=1 Tax=Erythrobacter sp. THAF29 TaxID=2587851 RepID=UPI0012687FDB|nr:hypothetical protein [Erythrobacter sp. THAF29]QFT76912.1 hypothetical protein FIU90_05100 [Erythrobacter sp. THAF29]